jgi:hypothetical protein
MAKGNNEMAKGETNKENNEKCEENESEEIIMNNRNGIM